MKPQEPLPALRNNMKIAKDAIDAANPFDIANGTLGNQEKKAAIHKECHDRIKPIINALMDLGISGRLPQQIRSLALYGLSFLTSPYSDNDIEEVILAATNKVLGPKDFEFYYDLYLEGKKEAGERVNQTAGKIEHRLHIPWLIGYVSDVDGRKEAEFGKILETRSDLTDLLAKIPASTIDAAFAAVSTWNNTQSTDVGNGHYSEYSFRSDLQTTDNLLGRLSVKVFQNGRITISIGRK